MNRLNNPPLSREVEFVSKSKRRPVLKTDNIPVRGPHAHFLLTVVKSVTQSEPGGKRFVPVS